MKFIERIAYYLPIAGAVVMLLAPLWWFFELPVHYTPVFSAGVFLCVCLLLARKRFFRAAVLACVVLYVAIPFIGLWFFVPSIPESADRQAFSIMQVNVNSINKKYELLVETVEAKRPTIIALNEVSDAWISALDERVGYLYPHRMIAASDDSRGMAILSQVEFSNERTFVVDEDVPPVLFAYVPKFDMTIVAAHTMPPLSARLTRERDRHSMLLADQLAGTRGRVILAADLNTTMHTFGFKKFMSTSGMSDARRGYGWKPSWMHGTVLAAAIDHILYKGEGASVTGFSILPDIGSDHRPVYSTFAVTRQKNDSRESE